MPILGMPLFLGADVKKIADLTAQDLTAGVAITWDMENYDVGGWHESVTFPARLTVPAGVTRVQLMGQVSLANVGAANLTVLDIRKDGTSLVPQVRNRFVATTTIPTLQVISEIVPVASPSYFELFVTHATDTSADISHSGSFFAIRAIW